MAGTVVRHKLYGNYGVSLFELLVAILLLALASGMIYSVMQVGIRFSEKGEAKLLAIAREQGILDLLHQQIKSAWFDQKLNKLGISADQDMLRVVTCQPLVFRTAGVVLAIYRYNETEHLLYYLEKQDYYNTDYGDTYVPEYDDMQLLAKNVVGLTMEFYDKEMKVTIGLEGREYDFYPKATGAILGLGQVP